MEVGANLVKLLLSLILKELSLVESCSFAPVLKCDIKGALNLVARLVRHCKDKLKRVAISVAIRRVNHNNSVFLQEIKCILIVWLAILSQLESERTLGESVLDECINDQWSSANNVVNILNVANLENLIKLTPAKSKCVDEVDLSHSVRPVDRSCQLNRISAKIIWV